MTDTTEDRALIAEIIASYVSNNSLPAAELPKLIREVRAALIGEEKAEIEKVAETQEAKPSGQEKPLVPAMPIERSVTEEAIYCLECGKPFRSLKRHLKSAHDLDEKEYRARWGLAKDYPLTAPAYSRARAETAKRIGLGRKPRRA